MTTRGISRVLSCWALFIVPAALSRSLGSVSPVLVDPNPPAGEKAGSPPFELVRSDRSEVPTPQVTFDHLQGWTIAVDGDADVTMRSSIAERIWRDSVAKLSYGRGSRPTTAIIRPPEPILISDKFDASKLWVFGGYYRQAQNDENPPTIAVLLQDADGKSWRIDCGAVVSGNWSLEQGALPKKALSTARFPMKFMGLEVASLECPGTASNLYIESLTFYTQQRNPSRHPFKPLNPGVPTSDSGMLPTPPADIDTEVRQISGGVHFTSKSPDGTLNYEVKPEDGFLNGISASWNGAKSFQPCVGGSLLVGVPDAQPTKLGEGAEPVAERVDGDTYTVTYRQDYAGHPVVWSATYALKGRTLVVDVSCIGGIASGVDFGEVSGLSNPKPVFVPYMMFERIGGLHTAGPMIACASDIFLSVLPDIYHCDCSTIDNTPAPLQDGKLRLFTGTSYFPLTNGRRNDLHDRIMITASPRFEEILPNARNPVSVNYEKMAQFMPFSTYFPALEMFSAIRRLGINDVIVMDKNSCIVGNGYEDISSFATRWRPMPQVSIRQFQDYVREIKSLGYKFSHYSFFPDLSPTNEFWDESKVGLTSDGSLVMGDWYGDFSTKMNDESRLVAVLCPLIKDLYGPECTYLDTQTNFGPTSMDFEAGVGGAGIGRITMLANADVMLEARKQYGMTISEGYHRWLYAGCVDADYATMIYPPTYASAADVPPLVDFDLLKIHPFEHATMMSFEPNYFLAQDGPEIDQLMKEDGHGIAPAPFYRYLATSIAYGHMAMIGYDYIPHPSRIIQLYALMMAAQRQYLTDSVRSINYEDGNTFYSTSDALRRGIVKKGHLRIMYDHGLVVYVNLSASGTWTVPGNGQFYVLPAYGWLIEKPGELLEFSALIDGGRVDAVHCAEYRYVNTGDREVSLPQWGLNVRGGVWIKTLSGGSLQVIPCGDLGQWDMIHPNGWPSSFFARCLGNCPPNRGLESLEIDLPQWFGANSKVTAVARAMDLSETPYPISNAAKLTIHGQTPEIDYILRSTP